MTAGAGAAKHASWRSTGYQCSWCTPFIQLCTRKPPDTPFLPLEHGGALLLLGALSWGLLLRPFYACASPPQRTFGAPGTPLERCFWRCCQRPWQVLEGRGHCNHRGKET